MSIELRDTLHRAAAVPSRPLDIAALRSRARRRRRRQAATAAASVAVVAGAAALVGLTVPEPSPRPPSAHDRPATGPIRLADLPAGWTRLPAPPEVREYAATAWTGDLLVTWGGWVPRLDGGTQTVESGGYLLDSDTGRWRALPPSPLPPRGAAATAWTGEELLVWGGVADAAGAPRWLADGAAFDPVDGTWRQLPPAPISARAPLSVWTGHELLVWGTSMRRHDVPTDGAAYDPGTDSWRPIAGGPVELTDAVAAWTGQEMIVFGASLDSLNVAATTVAIGAAYDPATDTWRRLPDSPLSPQASTAAWNGQELVAWDYHVGAAAYHPDLDQWRPLPDPPLGPAECYPASVPAGAGVFGEFCGELVVYESGLDRWQPVSGPGFDSRERDPDARARWLQLLAADPVVLLLGRVADQPALFAYRHPA